VNFINKILLLSIVALFISCEESTSSDTNEEHFNSTLENPNLDGITGNIDDYFYDLDESEVPYVNSKFYRYSGLSIIEPLAFDADSDTLNFITVSDYVLKFSPSELIDEMIALESFDETVDGQDINGDGEVTGGTFSGIYRFEEINFSHTYTDVIKLEWDEDNERYMVVSAPGQFSPLAHRYIIGNPDSLYENNRYDVGEVYSDDNLSGSWDEGEDYIDAFAPDMNDDYDSLVYITQINFNDLNGFYFSDDDENGYWDEGEQWDLPDSSTYQYYFDTNQLSYVDSVYSSQNLEITHDFSFSKSLIATDSLMFKISTDCNDNGQWDDAETSDLGNSQWDPAEPFLNQGGDDDIEYDIGEPFLDRNCNGQWDDAEVYTDDDENGQWDDGESFIDTGNGILDGAELCADGTTNCSYELLYTMSDRPNVLMASYDSNNWTVYENIDLSTVINPRWGDNSYQLIQSYDQVETKSKSTAMVDKVETVYSYQIIENTFEDGKDYSISKVIWDEFGDGNRSVAYHLFRKDETGNIVELVHDSYFTLPTTTPGSSIDGGSFEDYLVFDNLPMEQTYLHTYNGLLRDGERHQSSRIAYSPTTNAQYYVTETYEVNSDTLLIPQLNSSYDAGEEYLDANENQQWDLGEDFTDEFTILGDVFKITRTKNSIMQGSGLELVELNNIWLAKNYGIVKDEMEFRFNEPDDFDGFYRLELVSCRHCQEASSDRAFASDPVEVDFNQLKNTGNVSDNFKKQRTFGLQKLTFDSQP
tara:strand:+ start:223 stop:2496 length:2274 start_codon:yes stop_codon:yes gene_type:complete